MGEENRRYVTLDEQKKILVDLLLEFDSFCRENKLKYFLYAGTLLGAVRHSGFIPWDDDVDVCMPRADYDKFLEIYSDRPKKYKLASLNRDKEYYYPYAKLVNDETVLIENKDSPENLGVYLDIFPLDNCSGSTIEEAYKSIDKMSFLRWLRNFKVIDFSKGRKVYKNIILFFGKVLTLPFSCRKISQMLSDKASRSKDSNCQYMGELVNTAYGHGEVFDKSQFGEGKTVIFENHEFIAPMNYDYVLKSMYGDYMKLPPVEKRVSHHDIVCWYK